MVHAGVCAVLQPAVVWSCPQSVALIAGGTRTVAGKQEAIPQVGACEHSSGSRWFVRCGPARGRALRVSSSRLRLCGRVQSCSDRVIAGGFGCSHQARQQVAVCVRRCLCAFVSLVLVRMVGFCLVCVLFSLLAVAVREDSLNACMGRHVFKVCYSTCGFVYRQNGC